MASQAEEFLAYLRDNPHVRNSLYDAVEDEIVEAAKTAGFEITSHDLQTLAEEHGKGGRSIFSWHEMRREHD